MIRAFRFLAAFLAVTGLGLTPSSVIAQPKRKEWQDAKSSDDEALEYEPAG
jgi:hypothetical protein